MNLKFEKRLVELIDQLYEDSRYLLNHDTMTDVNLASAISYLKGHAEILKENFKEEE